MTRSSWFVPAALSCAVLAGCAGTPITTTPPAASASSTGDAIGWMDKYCGAVSGIFDGARTMPGLDLASPEKMVTSTAT